MRAQAGGELVPGGPDAAGTAGEAPRRDVPAPVDPQGDPYADLLERARALAAEKRARGEIPPGTGEALDRLFLEIAPPGARAEGEGIGALVEMLSRYSFDPTIPIDSSRRGLAPVMRIVKRLLRPLAAWQLRYLTDQLNAYKAAETQVLRALLREVGETDAAP